MTEKYRKVAGGCLGRAGLDRIGFELARRLAVTIIEHLSPPSRTHSNWPLLAVTPTALDWLARTRDSDAPTTCRMACPIHPSHWHRPSLLFPSPPLLVGFVSPSHSPYINPVPPSPLLVHTTPSQVPLFPLFLFESLQTLLFLLSFQSDFIISTVLPSITTHLFLTYSHKVRQCRIVVIQPLLLRIVAVSITIITHIAMAPSKALV